MNIPKIRESPPPTNLPNSVKSNKARTNFPPTTRLPFPVETKNTEIFILAKKLLNDLKIKNLIVTMGANGAILISNKGDKIQCPAFEKNVVDKIGAGDAMLTVISLALNVNVPKDLTLFFGSIIASMSIKIVANKKSINFTDFYRAVEFCLK
jgi:fructose-1-phosphate kinase PfkB-like protein